MTTDDGTILAIATPSAPTLRAIIRISGPDAHAAVRRVLAPNSLSISHVSRPLLATNLGPFPSLVTLSSSPNTATGEDTAEIHLPGSPYIVQATIDALIKTGLVRQALPGEFTQRAFLNGRMDLAQAEAVMAIVSASSATQAVAAASLLRGGFSKRIEALVRKLEDLCARLELSFDFDEEAAEQADESAFAATARNLLLELRHATNPQRAATREFPTIVLAGPTNVGKSTLFNALVGSRRTAVADESGTTRDAVESSVTFGPYHATIIDTAGFKTPQNAIEIQALQSTANRIREASLLIICDDSASDTPQCDPEIAAAIASLPHDKVLYVRTKADLLRGVDTPVLQSNRLLVSATTSQGIHDLTQAITARLAATQATESTWVSARVRSLCQAATEALADAVEILEGNGPLEAASGTARSALSNLREALGRGASTDILDHAFANFCIGK